MSKVSKSARISTKTPEQQFIETANHSDIPRLVSLNGGRFCYLRNPVTMQTTKFKTDSVDFFTALLDLASKGMADRLKSELESLAVKAVSSEESMRWIYVIAAVFSDV